MRLAVPGRPIGFMAKIFSRARSDDRGAKGLRRLLSVMLAASLLSGACFACRNREDPVRACLDGLAQAARDRDAKAFMSLVAPAFEAADGTGRVELENQIRRFFSVYEILDVQLKDVTIERAEAAALVLFRAELAGQPRKISGLEGLFPPSSSYRFEARLVPIDGRWRVAWASWSPAPP